METENALIVLSAHESHEEGDRSDAATVLSVLAQDEQAQAFHAVLSSVLAEAEARGLSRDDLLTAVREVLLSGDPARVALWTDPASVG